MMLLHAGVFTHRSFYTQSVYTDTEKLLHRCFIQKLLHRQACSQIHTKVCLHRRLCAEQLLHFTHGTFHTAVFTTRCCYTEKPLHTVTFTREAFTQGSLYTTKLLPTDTFTIPLCFLGVKMCQQSVAISPQAYPVATECNLFTIEWSQHNPKKCKFSHYRMVSFFQARLHIRLHKTALKRSARLC